ncbi:MAG: hypothetical protein Q4F05_14960 [bacterium]|nr:hypothetical protein [bacterium]
MNFNAISYNIKKCFACKTFRAERNHEVINSFRVSAHLGFLVFRKPFLLDRRLLEEKFPIK